MYKGGQAGITKATVTITFDNSDSRQSPLGYESYEEITVSRQVQTSLSVLSLGCGVSHISNSVCLSAPLLSLSIFFAYLLTYYPGP